MILGGTLGHALCTGLAVLGGRFIAQRISVKTGATKSAALQDTIFQVNVSVVFTNVHFLFAVTLIGGVVFLIFAVSAFFIDPDE